MRTPPAANPEHVRILSTAVAEWFVRRDSKFYDIENPNVQLSKDDVQRISLMRIGEEFPDLRPTPVSLSEAFQIALETKHALAGSTVPVWNGSFICKPNIDARTVHQRGMVRINTWKAPSYRQTAAQPTFGVAGEFFDAIFEREAEKAKFLDWCSWNLQNEGSKPTWAPFFYSETKGSGKSTLGELLTRLFGPENTAVQNNVDKLTTRFNMPVLTRKLIICEEVHLRQDSPQGNALKTYLTETTTMSERKHHDAEAIEQCCCFMFTSNHLPLWIEHEDRRYYLIELDHDGHAAGPQARDFSGIVARLKEEMKDEQAMAGLYLAIMERRQSDGFSAKTLNIVEDATPLMKRIQGASEQTNLTLLRERLAELRLHAIPEKDAFNLVRDELHTNPNSTRHLFSQIGWSATKAKWDRAEFSKSVWSEKGYCVAKGMVQGPDGFEEAATVHFARLERQFGDLG